MNTVRVLSAVGLILALPLVACEEPAGEAPSESSEISGGDVGEPDMAAPDVPEPDADQADTEGPDAEVADAPKGQDDAEISSEITEPDITEPDISEPDISEPINPADMVALNCETDASCVVNCASGGTCAEDGRCAFALIEGCLIADDTGDVAICRAPGSLEPDSLCLFCNPAMDQGAWTPTVAHSDFESGLGSLSQVSTYGDSEASWSVSTTRAASGESSLYFGDPETQSYATGGHAFAQVFAPSVQVPEGAELTLTFSLWLQTEELPGYDLVKVLVRQDGEPPTEIWTSDAFTGTTHGLFVPVQVELTGLGGSQVAIGFAFDSQDGLDNGYEGAYLDDIRVSTGCCAVAGDCDDAHPCTEDLCPAYGQACVHDLAEGCCSSDSDCDDQNPCTVDVCLAQGGACESTPLVGCCLDDEACDDGDPCTQNTCTEPGGICLAQSTCCDDESQCDDEDSCTADSCHEGSCVHDYTCCTSDQACDDGEYCTMDSCQAGVCAHQPAILPGCCSLTIEHQDFETTSIPYGWTGGATDGVGWHVAEVGKSQSGSKVLYYGDPSTQNYDDGSANSGTITTASFYIPVEHEATLSFKAYLDVESSSWSDKLTVKILAESNTLTIATKSNLSVNSWKTFTTDISYLSGQNIQLSFTFETTGPGNNSGLGVLIDDLVIATTCEPKVCTSNNACPSADSCLSGVCSQSTCSYVNSCCYDADDCDDEQVCTVDTCQNGKCQFTAEAGCCEDLDDCDDGNPCTTDLCSGFGGSCSWEDVPECCLTHADCQDDDGCTLDKCVDNVCLNTDICCADASECDDGDDLCTLDACVDSFCTFEPTGAEGCCEQSPVTWDFESPVGLDFSSSTSCTWQQISSGQNQTQDGDSLLWYGMPGENDYDCGLNNGTAISETLSLQGGVAFSLSFKLMMDTEISPSYDKLFLYVIVNGQEYELWSKAQLTTSKAQWGEYQIDLSAFAGEEIQIKIHFDTKDSVLNSSSGVFMDDLLITSPCLPAPCTSDADCDDQIGGTTGFCAGVGCAFSL